MWVNHIFQNTFLIWCGKHQHNFKFDTWNVNSSKFRLYYEKYKGVELTPYAFLSTIIDQTPHRHQAIIYSIFLTISQNPNGCMGGLGVVSEDRIRPKFWPEDRIPYVLPGISWVLGRQNTSQMGAGKTTTAYNKAEDEDEITPIHPSVQWDKFLGALVRFWPVGSGLQTVVYKMKTMGNFYPHGFLCAGK